MRPRLALLFSVVMLFALPAATALAAPKARVRFQQKVTVVAENASDGMGHVVVTRKRRLNDTVTVGYTSASTTAVAGSACGAGADFVQSSGTLTFAPNETSKEILVPVCDDVALEGAEFVDLSLVNPGSGVVASNPRARLVIADNDGPARLAFADVDFANFENQGPASVPVLRLGDPNPAVSVDYATSGGTATAGSDYTAAGGTLNFPSISSDPVAATIQTLNVGLVNDASAELDETVGLALSNPRDTVAGTPLPAGDPKNALLTILDDDSPATISFAPDSPTTVSESGGTLTVILRRSGAPGDTVTASYATSDRSAHAGSDYTTTVFDSTAALADPLFDPNEIEVALSIPILDDNFAEAAETFGLALSNIASSSGPVSPSLRPSMLATINDDDGGPGSPGGSDSPTGGVLDETTGACGLTVKASKIQKVLVQKGLRAAFVAKRFCTVRARATIKKARKAGFRRAIRTRVATTKLTPGRTANVKLRFSRKQMKTIKKALRAKKRVVASVTITEVGPTGRVSKRTLSIRLKR